MDTKFWGPSGWKLLHSITFMYEPATQKAAMRDWLATIPYVLPCKFCRASLADYYRADPPKLDSRLSLARWLYRIHGRVNNKLREQGQTIPKDPTFSEVRRQYEMALAGEGPRQCESFPGWDFLFSIAYNHPFSVKGAPMPDSPTSEGMDDEELNRWNLLPSKRRFIVWRRFWTLLPAVMPPAWRIAWHGGMPQIQNRKTATAWLWRTRCSFSHGADPYRVVCRRLATYESGCSKSLKARTCRRERKKRGQIKTRRK
jgi:hypothetical protein